MSWIFLSCNSISNLDLSHFNTSNVTNMSYMFNGCNNLTNLDLSSFDISKITNMLSMFSNMPTNALIYVKDETTQNLVLTSNNNRPTSWTTDNIIIKS